MNPAWVGLYAVDHVLSLSGCEHALLTIEQAKLRLEGGEDGWAVLSIASVSQFSEEWHLRSQFLFGAPAGFEQFTHRPLPHRPSSWAVKTERTLCP